MNVNQFQAVGFGKSSRALDFLGCATSFLLLAFSFGGGLFRPAHAAQPPAPLTISSNRYLFIVDTSLSMKSRASGALQRIEALLLSELNGNLLRGDTLGLWTFNEKLYAGQFPMQVWSPEQKQIITKRFIAFMKIQPIEKKPKIAQAMAQVSELVKNSDNLTVLLLSVGDAKMRGTPFDDEINAVYKQQSRAMQKAGMPFVTVLRAQHGKIFAHSVNFVPWPIEIPPFPNSIASVQLPPAKPAATNLPPPTVTAATNKVASTIPQGKVAPVAEVKNEKPVGPENVTLKTTVPSLAPANVDKTIERPPVKSDTPSVTAPPAPLKPATTTAVNEAPKLETATLKPSEPAPPPAAIQSAVSSPPVKSKPVGANVEPKTAEPVAKSPPPSETAKTDDQAAEPESSTPPIQTAAAVPSSSWFSSGGLLIAAIVLLLAAFGLVGLFIRRARNISQPSLITRSLDHREK